MGKGWEGNGKGKDGKGREMGMEMETEGDNFRLASARAFYATTFFLCFCLPNFFTYLNMGGCRYAG